MDGELWHLVEARREDGTPTMFRIRELEPRRELSRIFVVELPYPKTEMSRLPSAGDYRRLSQFEEQWLAPACGTLGWELVGSKTEDGSFFLYMYGAADPTPLMEKLASFDANLGFYDDEDPEWAEYGTLRELLEQAKMLPPAVAEASGEVAAVAAVEPAASEPEATARRAPIKKAAKKPAAKKPAAKKPAAKANAKAKTKAGAQRAKGGAKKKPARASTSKASTSKASTSKARGKRR